MKRLKSVYTSGALVVLNTLLVLIATNLILGCFYFVYDRYKAVSRTQRSAVFNADGSPADNGKRSPFQLQWFDYNATREVSEAEASEVLDDFFELLQKGFIYQPWVQFSEPPFTGKRVSVGTDESGFPVRTTINPPLEGDEQVISVFVLGGSTTFGYHVADEHTWPSYLSAILNEKARAEGLNVKVRVMNYGRGYYDTSQEMVLLTDLLKNGQRPSLVVFMDGVNWGTAADAPRFTKELADGLANLQSPSPEIASRHTVDLLTRWLPMMRLARSIHSRLSSPPPANPSTIDGEPTESGIEYVSQVRARFEQNRRLSRAVGREYGVQTLFFLQPDPLYNYPLELYRNSAPVRSRRKLRELFYQSLNESGEVINLGHLFAAYGVGENRKVIIDNCHYSPNFSRFLAEQVAAYIDLKGLPRVSPAVNASSATGRKRETSAGH